MITRNLIKPNRYQDSVTLMQVAERVRARDGITAAALMMGTPPNKEILHDAAQLTVEGAAAGPNDLIIALQGTAKAVAAVEGDLEDLLRAEIPAPTDHAAAAIPHSLAGGLAAQPDTNFVLLSTPGLYAAAEARKALLAGRHVMIFSDNVSLDDEESLKRLAGERGLLLMGPDCGTAIIGGVPLGFANVVRRGPIGVVGASGTGTQEVTTLIDRYGSGVSHAIGTGSHDLSQRIGGAMTIAALHALLADPATAVVVVLSKPPHPTIAARVAEAAADAAKLVVFAFLGLDPTTLPPTGDQVHFAQTLEDAARQAVLLVGGTPTPTTDQPSNTQYAIRNTQYVRGLFSGGTFAYEAMLILQAALGPVYSNIPLRPDLALPDPAHSREHTVLDLGADEFTVGRPHPMIDLSVRADRIRREAADPSTGVILLDVVLGYGAHPDPAHGLADAIRAAHTTAAAAGRPLTIVASVCGTEADPQRLSTQQAQLAAAGVTLAPSNAAAARLAARAVSSEQRAASG